jgi:uncharacterized protein YqhQ
MASRPGDRGRASASRLQAAVTERDGLPAVPVAARLPDGELTAQRDAPLGGQAVLEGVMMRGVRHWAVAVRKTAAKNAVEAAIANGAHGANAVDGAYSAVDGTLSNANAVDDTHSNANAVDGALSNANAVDGTHSNANAVDGAHSNANAVDGAPGGEAPPGEIEVSVFPLESALARHRWLRLPILRGIVALGGSLAIGFKALSISANAQLPEGEADEEPQEISGGVWAATVVVALAFAIGLFFLLPLGLTSLVKGQLHSSVLFWVIEGVLRTAIFLAYMLALSRLKDLRRVFEYHGAEHKTISCFEAGLPLTPQNAQRFSRLHPRCGTSFLLVVMIVSIFVFGAVGLPAWYLLVATRILGVPVIAGISFEIIKFAGRNRSRGWVKAIMWPGLKLQLLTTREPSLDQLAVAIAALDAVLELEKPGSIGAHELVGVEVVA